MKIYCDASPFMTCCVIKGQKPLIVPHEHATNNESEYYAVLRALELANIKKLESVEILSDSQLVINQINSLYECKNTRMRNLRNQVRQQAALLPKVIFTWIPREENLAGIILEKMK